MQLALIVVICGAALGQQIVQPGAPGKASKRVSAANATSKSTVANADVEFMQGMIMHHEQAVEMVALLKVRGASKELQELGERMRISQSDEIGFMKRWLTERGKPTGMKMVHDMSTMTDKMPSMPGMLSTEQMKALREASGASFDHLFLTGMIQHHTGALIMVDDLNRTAGAGQDPTIYDFATDIDNTQSAEIAAMQALLNQTSSKESK